ncbi:MAG: hypothetical protein LIO99_02785, partial [Clostridiales bacterium]|nr:hypothetical protein [Clostridiales bacterium]
MNKYSETDILFLLPWYPLPRVIRRIEVANMAGITSVIYWDKNNAIEFPNDIPKGTNVYRISSRCKNDVSIKRI